MAPRKKASVAAPTAVEARAALVAVLGEAGAKALLGAASVAVRESRAVKVIHNTGTDATKYGDATIGKSTTNGFIPGVGIKGADLRYVAGELLTIADIVDPVQVEETVEVDA